MYSKDNVNSHGPFVKSNNYVTIIITESKLLFRCLKGIQAFGTCHYATKKFPSTSYGMTYNRTAWQNDLNFNINICILM